MTEPTLFPPPTPTLTERQQLVYDAVVAAGHEGLTADEAGAIVHARHTDGIGFSRPGRHPSGDRCEYCARDGRSVLTSKALKGLVKRRRGGGYVVRDARVLAAAEPSSQTEDIPF